MSIPTANTAQDGAAETASAKDRACETLAGFAREGVDVHRCYAVQALGHIGRNDDVPVLIGCLLDEDEDVRSDAATALARILDPRAAPQLLDNLIGDPCGDVKTAALSALTAMNYTEVVPWLRRLVVARDGEIAWDDDEFFAGGWDDWVDLQLKAIEALGTFQEAAAVPDILAAIDDEDGQDVTEVAFRALPRMGDAGLNALIAFLDDRNVRRRRRAATVLAGLPAGVANDAVIKSLKDPEAEVRMAAVRILAQKNAADPRLVPLMQLGDPGSRAEVIGLIGAANADKLPALLDDDYVAVRAAALAAMAQVPPTAIAPTDPLRAKLHAHARHDEPAIAAAAAPALARYYPEDRAVLAEIADETSRPAEVRLAALSALAGSPDDRTVRLLIDAVGDEDRRVRLATMTALADLANGSESFAGQATETLLAALRGELVAEPEPEEEAVDLPANDDATVEDASAGDTAAEDDAEDADAFPTSTLDTILSPAGEAIAVDSEDDGETLLSPEDLEYLGLVGKGPKKRKIDIKAALAPHQDVRRFAARVLGDVAQDGVAEALADQLGAEDKDLVLAAADSLSRLAAKRHGLTADMTEALLGQLRGQANRDARVLLVRALGYGNYALAAQTLINGLADTDAFIRMESLKGLARNGDEGTGIARFLDDPDSAVRLTTAQIIAARKDAGDVPLLAGFAFKEEGYHGRETARMLRGIDADAATDAFLDALGQDERRRFWQVAIQALEELHGTGPDGDRTRTAFASI